MPVSVSCIDCEHVHDKEPDFLHLSLPRAFNVCKADKEDVLRHNYIYCKQKDVRLRKRSSELWEPMKEARLSSGRTAEAARGGGSLTGGP